MSCQVNQEILGVASTLSKLAEMADLVNQSGKRVVYVTRLHRSSTCWTLCIVQVDLAGLAHNVTWKVKLKIFDTIRSKTYLDLDIRAHLQDMKAKDLLLALSSKLDTQAPLQ